MNKYLEEILKEMCKRVKADYSKIVFNEDDWFYKYSWTINEENDYVNWLIEYLQKNKKACQEIMKYPSSDKKYLLKFAQKFVSNYGWKYNQKINI
jgi:hypothetical protein